jgi:hypothetical protein
MPMNPRTLRPGSTFTPRSISGLALWLDAADTQSLYTTDAGPVTAVSAPTEISGCALWLDGADSSAASMLLNGSLVETWKDKSGNGRDFTATGTARPTLTATAINSRSAVTCNGSTNTLTGNTAAQGVIRNLAGYTVFAVLRTASIAAGERLAFGVGATVLLRTGQTDSRSFIGGRRVAADTLESITGAASDLSVGTTFIQTAAVNHAAQSLTGLRNGAAFGLDTTYMAAGVSENVASSVSVGTQAGGTYGFWNGEIAEIVVFNTALSTTDRARVEAYLAAKWGISGVHAQATATNDPVGYWRDKSGNNRHATQATGASRAKVASVALNGRKSIGFDGTDDSLELPALDITPATVLGVVRHSTGTSAAARTPFALSEGGSYLHAQFIQSGASQMVALTHNAARASYIANGVDVLGASFLLSSSQSASGGGTVGRLNGTDLPYSAAIQDSGGANRIGCRYRNSANDQFWNGQVAEFLVYQSALSSSQITRLERYLAAKWGITLAPQVSNADAQDWVNRVYANGGTVSSTTATAVNTFCNAIDAAGLRDRFYRLNLFCGTGLSACLVPLYRGPSLGGTQYGNATDTNNGPFVSGDYSESAGLGRLVGEAKRLDTGLATSALPPGVIGSGHLAVWHGPLTGAFAATGESDPVLIGAFNGAVDRVGISLTFRSATSGNNSNRWGRGTVATESSGVIGLTKPSAFLLGQRTSATNLELWRNGAIVGTNATSTTGIAGITHSILVFGYNNSGTAAGELNALLLRGYSVGDDMTSSQVLAFRAAWSAFNTALGRTA